MMTLVWGLVAFLVVHSFRLIAPNARHRMMTAMGPLPYKVAYSVASLLGFGLLVHGFSIARQTEALLWVSPFWVKHLSLALMWPAMVMLVSSFVPGSGIRAKLRHPMTLSVKTWAFAHLIANGHLADVLLFGSMLVWSILIYRSAKEEDRSRMVGLMGSGAHLVNLGTLISVVLGSLVWFWMAMGGGHRWLIGVSPLG
jgi:uncharacterized membrane protein